MVIALQIQNENLLTLHANKCFPNDNIVVYIMEGQDNGWLKQAITKSKYVIVDRASVPIWIEEHSTTEKIHYVSDEQTVEQVFEKIQKESN